MLNDSRLSSLDQLDFSIMNHLRDDGRKSFTELADMLGVSASTIRNRYAKLVEDNVLQVYGRIHPEHVGHIAYAHILIDVRPSERIAAVVEAIANFPEVCFLALATGEYDLVVDVMCRNNDHLLALTNERLNQLEGVYKTKVQMYTRLIKIAQPDLSGYFLSAENSLPLP
jgi:Lrp/AsnC family transcriptional regulator for asnA, asnC and gidA